MTLPPGAFASPSAARNRDPILSVLGPRLPASGLVLEVASGSGEHVIHFASALPGLTWQPSDEDDRALASIAAWRGHAGLPNVLPPVRLDATSPDSWPVSRADAVISFNMIHIAPWRAAEGLVAGAGRVLTPGGLLALYGPFFEEGVSPAPSNLAFDENLKSRDSRWGVRNLSAVAALAQANGLDFAERVEMPANNLTILFRKA